MCLSEPPSATCSSFPASISQSACNFHARQCPRHTAKQVKQFLEAKNIETMKWPAQCPELSSTENLWKILGDKVIAKKPTIVTELWKRVEEEWTKIKTEQCEQLVMSCGSRCAKSFKARASTLPTKF